MFWCLDPARLSGTDLTILSTMALALAVGVIYVAHTLRGRQ